MSYGFGLTIESLVAILLLLTILYCARLNKQIERLKADEKIMKGNVAELVSATERAERAIAGLKLTVKDADISLTAKLREAEIYSASMAEHLKSGEDLLGRLRKIAYANQLLSVPQAEPSAPADVAPEPKHDAKAVAAAALAIVERARARMHQAA